MDLSPGTAGTWVNTVGGEKVLPLIKVLKAALFIASFWHMEESPLQVLKSEKAPKSDHYMVVRAAGPPANASSSTTTVPRVPRRG